MLPAGAQVANRLLSIHTRLIEECDLAHGARKIFFTKVLTHFECVEARSHHEGELVVEKVADGADLALEIEPCAQHAGPRKAAPIAKVRKFDRDQRDIRQNVLQSSRIVIRLEANTERRGARKQALTFLQEPGKRYDGTAAGGNFLFVRDGGVWVRDEPVTFNDRHRRVP